MDAAWIANLMRTTPHKLVPFETSIRLFDAWAEFVFGRASRESVVDVSKQIGVPMTPRLVALLDERVEPKSHPIDYEVSARDVSETFSTGLMTNAVFAHVLTYLRKHAPPKYRVCPLEDYAEFDFVSFAASVCERGITEILSTTHLYDTPEYDAMYRRVAAHADMKLAELRACSTQSQKETRRKSLHLIGAHEVFLCPFLHANHYVLVVIDFTQRKVLTYDSLRGESDDPSIWETEALKWLSTSDRFGEFNDFEIDVVPVTRQGVNECGFAVCVFMRQWIHMGHHNDETYAQFKETLRNELCHPLGVTRGPISVAS